MTNSQPRTRLHRLRDAVEFRLWHGAAMLYVAAGSLIGFEALVVLGGYVAMWPVGIPAMILGIGIFALVRNRLRRRNRDVVGEP